MSSRYTDEESVAFDKMMAAFVKWLEVREQGYEECLVCQRNYLAKFQQLRHLRATAPNVALLKRIQELHTELEDLKGGPDE
jgi:hypothetical protein